MDELKKKFSVYYHYLEDILQRIYSLVVIFVVFSIVGFFSSGQILKLIVSFFKLDNATIATTSPFQFLELAMNIGFWVGLVFCFPFVIYHLYSFLRDGLTRNERKYFFILLFIGFALFFIGFAYIFAILYFYLDIAAAINLSFGIKNIWDIGRFLSQIITAGFLFGLFFQFPIVLTLLIRMKIVSLEFLKRNRPYAISLMLLFVGLIPPPDILSTIFEALPLIALYEITIVVNSILGHKERVDLPIIVEKAIV